MPQLPARPPRMQVPRTGSHDRIPERTDLIGQQNLKSQP